MLLPYKAFVYSITSDKGTEVAEHKKNHYETVFILNPVLSDVQVKETVKKFEDYLVSKGAEMIWKEDWGLKKLAYPIQKKKTGFYHLFRIQMSWRRNF